MSRVELWRLDTRDRCGMRPLGIFSEADNIVITGVKVLLKTVVYCAHDI
jgi:hypothetical protein